MLEKHNIKNFEVEEVHQKGGKKIANQTLEILSNCDIIYVSFDVDSMDCDMISYGTGTPVPKGFDDKEIVEIINGLLASNKVACVEFVEVNPLLDLKGNKMAQTAFSILDDVTKTISNLK